MNRVERQQQERAIKTAEKKRQAELKRLATVGPKERMLGIHLDSRDVNGRRTARVVVAWEPERSKLSRKQRTQHRAESINAARQAQEAERQAQMAHKRSRGARAIFDIFRPSPTLNELSRVTLKDRVNGLKEDKTTGEVTVKTNTLSLFKERRLEERAKAINLARKAKSEAARAKEEREKSKLKTKDVLSEMNKIAKRKIRKTTNVFSEQAQEIKRRTTKKIDARRKIKAKRKAQKDNTLPEKNRRETVREVEARVIAPEKELKHAPAPSHEKEAPPQAGDEARTDAKDAPTTSETQPSGRIDKGENKPAEPDTPTPKDLVDGTHNPATEDPTYTEPSRDGTQAPTGAEPSDEAEQQEPPPAQSEDDVSAGQFTIFDAGGDKEPSVQGEEEELHETSEPEATSAPQDIGEPMVPGPEETVEPDPPEKSVAQDDESPSLGGASEPSSTQETEKAILGGGETNNVPSLGGGSSEPSAPANDTLGGGYIDTDGPSTDQSPPTISGASV